MYHNMIEAFVAAAQTNRGIYFINSRNDEEFVSYYDMYDICTKLLGGFQKMGIHPGDEVVFQFNDNKEFIFSFWACILGGIIPVPVTVGNRNENAEKIKKIWEILKNPFLITTSKYKNNLSQLFEEYYTEGESQHILNKTFVIEGFDRTTAGNIHYSDEMDIAYIQFSSGSTGDPKGVILTHKNILTNVNAIIAGSKLDVDRDNSISWLPLTHDMGLIGMHITPFVLTGNQRFISPLLFIKDPLLLLNKISEHKITITSIPNFGYDYILKKIKVDREYNWDLSSLRIIFNGAEMISYELVNKFTRVMKQYKLDENAIFNVYGMAEASLAVSFPEVSSGTHGVCVQRLNLSIGDEIIEENTYDRGIVFVKLGKSVKNCNIKIVDDLYQEVGEKVVGNILIQGDNVTQGYYRRKDLNEELFDEQGWLITGDLGFNFDGEIVVIGRKKNVIIINGMNYYCHDLERIALNAVNDKWEIAVIGTRNEQNEDDTVVFVKYRGEIDEFLPICRDIRRAFFLEATLYIKDIIPVSYIPKTTSGKTRNFQLKEDYDAGEYKEVSEKINRLWELKAKNKQYVEPENEIQTTLLNIFKEVLETDQICIDDELYQYAIKSIQVYQIYEKINALYPSKIQIADLYRLFTIKEIADYLCIDKKQQVDFEKSMELEENENKTTEEAVEEIAIIGISLKFPNADNKDAFWNVIRNGIDCVTEFPKERAALISDYIDRKYVNEEVRYNKGAYLKHIEYFDNNFFGITLKEAELMDPVHRNFLQTAYEAFEDAGYTNSKLYGSNTGVYVGMISDIDIHSYKEMIRENIPELLPMAVTGTLRSTMAAMLAYHLNLKGPVIMTDTACSSSLVAVHQACSALRNRECDMAVAAGARLNLAPIDKDYYKIGIESSDGLTHTFDEGADGSGIGEGIGVIILKPLENAKRDRDYIYGVIKGSSVNHDGRSLGLTVPNAMAQEQVILDAWKNAHINPEDISYIECHGTATKLGDPIEIKGINSAFERFTNHKNFCAIASVKSNIGHLFDCSGMAGLIKAVLCIQHKELPATINFEQPNSKIDFVDSVVYVNSRRRYWEKENGKRICGISSFGLGGVNCHLILEEYDNIADSISSQYEYEEELSLVLSARNEEEILIFVKKYITYLKKIRFSLRDICYSTNNGKDFYPYSVEFRAKTKQEMYRKMEYVCSVGFEDGFNKEGIIMKHSSSKECRIKELKVYENANHVPVPTYPFNKKNCWLQKPAKEIDKTEAEKEKISTCEMENIKPTIDIAEENPYYNVTYIKSERYGLSKRSDYKNVLVISFDKSKEIAIGDWLEQKGIHTVFFNINKEDGIASIIHYEDIFKQFLFKNDIKHFECILFVPETFEDVCDLNINALKELTNRNLFSLFGFFKVLAALRITLKIDFILLTHNSYEVTGEEKDLHPYLSMLVGFGRNVNLEFSTVKCRVIDYNNTEDFKLGMEEAFFVTKEFFVAYRNRERYIEKFGTVNILQYEEQTPLIHENGTYIITGGLGNIGLKMAEYLSQKAHINMILVSRKKLPERETWDNVISSKENETLSEKLSILIGISNTGSRIDVYQADVSQEEDVEGLVRYVKSRYGNINGILHSAGVTGNGFISDKNEENVEVVIRPKIFGTWLLDKYTQEENLDFMIMCSSGAGIIGETGLADYTAANAFMDSYAAYRNRSRKTLVIDWVVWENARMQEGFSKNIDGFFAPLNADHAMKYMDEVLRRKVYRVLIGKINFKSKYMSILDTIPMAIEEKLLDRVKKYTGPKNESKIIKISERSIVRGSFSEIEKELMRIVSEITGEEEIDINTSFFELGINSIMLNYIYRSIEASFPNQIMISDLFAYPTIAQMAEFISNMDRNQETDNIKSCNIEDDIDGLLDSLKEEEDIDNIIEKIVGL